MSKPTISEHNCETGETTVREMNNAEIAAWEKAGNEAEEAKIAFEQERTIKAEAKSSALAKLTALGLTEEEITALTN
jgi:hypothetical protein